MITIEDEFSKMDINTTEEDEAIIMQENRFECPKCGGYLYRLGHLHSIEIFCSNAECDLRTRKRKVDFKTKFKEVKVVKKTFKDKIRRYWLNFLNVLYYEVS